MHTEGKKTTKPGLNQHQKRRKNHDYTKKRALKKRKAFPRLPRLHDKHKNSQQNGALKREAKKNMRARARLPTTYQQQKGAPETWPQAAGEEEETMTPRAISNKIQN